MKTTKHFALAALLVLVATLSAGTPARAQVDVGTIDLENTGLLPGASGQATLSDVMFLGDYFIYDFTVPSTVHVYVYAGELTLTCQGLKPGAKYLTPFGLAKAAPDGTLNLSGPVSYSHYWSYGSVGWWAPPGDSSYLGGGLSANVSNAGNKRIVLSGWFGYPYW